MALGDTNASDSPTPPPGDAGAAVQQANQAGDRMAAETNLVPMPVGNMAMASPASLPDFAVFNAGAGGVADSADSPTGKIDKTKSVGQLMSAGVFQPLDATAAAAAPRTDAPPQALKPGESPQVTVTYADANTGPNQKAPDFVVKQDGTIEAAGDPSAINKKDVVIQVERPPGSTANPAAGQQQSIDGLVTYLKDRYSADNPAVAQNGIKLNDQYGLISDNVTQQVAAAPTAADAAATTAAARQNFAPQTQAAMSQGSRFTPGSSGSMSRGDVNQVVPERSAPMAQDETASTADMKNAIAAEFRPDAATAARPNAPYETSRMDRVGTNTEPAVGRYGMSFNIFRGWFATNCGGDGDFDDDNIAEKMDFLAKHGKVSKAFAAKFHDKAFAHGFVHMMHEMKDGHAPSHEDMAKYMPAQLQEQITADVVGKFAQQAHGDTGKVALAFHLGKSPDQLSAAETGDKGNQEYQRTATTFGSLSHVRDHMGSTPDSKVNYTVGQDGTVLDAQIKKAAINTADSIGGTHSQHRCAEGVQLAWAKAGYKELLGSGDGWQMHNKLDRDPNFVRVDRDTAYKAVQDGHAAIVCRQWASNGNGAGHVETLMAGSGGGIIGASDYHGEHRAQNDYYNWQNDHFYLPKADVTNA